MVTFIKEQKDTVELKLNTNGQEEIYHILPPNGSTIFLSILKTPKEPKIKDPKNLTKKEEELTEKYAKDLKDFIIKKVETIFLPEDVDTIVNKITSGSDALEMKHLDEIVQAVTDELKEDKDNPFLGD